MVFKQWQRARAGSCAVQQMVPGPKKRLASVMDADADFLAHRLHIHERVKAVVAKKDALAMCALSSPFQSIKRIGTESVHGQAFVVRHEELPMPIAAKIMYANSDNRTEVKLYMQLGKMVASHQTPHLPVVFAQNECDICLFTGDASKRPASHGASRCIVLMSELAQGDLKSWLQGNHATRSKSLSLVAQLLMGLHVLEHIGYVHNDLHWGNVLYHDVSKSADQYIWYKVMGSDGRARNVYIKHNGALWVLWDFGKMRPAGKSSGANVDLRRIMHFEKWAKKAGVHTSRLPLWLFDMVDGMARTQSAATILLGLQDALTQRQHDSMARAWGRVVLVDPPAEWVSANAASIPSHPNVLR